jgi:hypothetical protein
LEIDAPVERVEDFVARVLSLNPAERADYFPDPDPDGKSVQIVSCFTQQREEILREKATIPEFVVFSDEQGIIYVSGLLTYLKDVGVDQRTIDRLPNHREIRQALLRLQKGYHLEALAAAILKARCQFASATKGSGDQGVDALGWDNLLPVERSFCAGHLSSDNEPLPGDRVFIIASSKAGSRSNGGKPNVLNPAAVRELVGSWLIQRTQTGIWREHGIQMLSPVQVILVTTHRMSADARLDCHELGIQVWSIPEMIYLICLCAPDYVFDSAFGCRFASGSLRKWWGPFDHCRLSK